MWGEGGGGWRESKLKELLLISVIYFSGEMHTGTKELYMEGMRILNVCPPVSIIY